MAAHLLTAALVAVLHGSSNATTVQAPPSAAGRWEGAIQIPAQELKIQIDLQGAGEKWEGTIAIPAQGLKGFPLSAITVQGEAVTFAMKGLPGTPEFTGTLSKDGKTLSGDFKQGGGSIPFSVTRTGEAKIERPPASTVITKDLEGSWEGVVTINGKMLRLVLKLANQPGGPASGMLVSVDQGGAEVPIASVVQSGLHLTLVLPSIAGNYEGDLKDGQLTGTWTQGPGTWPLVFKKQ